MKLKSIFIAAAVLLGATPAMADTSIGAKISTLGLGVEVTTNVVPMLLNVRVLGSGYNYASSTNYAGINYDATLKLQSAGAILDLYPFAGKFRISGGLFYNNNKIDLSTPTQSVNIGGTVYTSNVTGTIKFNQYSPYVGIGFGDSVSSGSPIGFNIEAGVLSQGTPKVSMQASNTLVPTAKINAEAQQLESSLSSYKYYPVIGAGITIKF